MWWFEGFQYSIRHETLNQHCSCRILHRGYCKHPGMLTVATISSISNLCSNIYITTHLSSTGLVSIPIHMVVQEVFCNFGAEFDHSVENMTNMDEIWVLQTLVKSGYVLWMKIIMVRSDSSTFLFGKFMRISSDVKFLFRMEAGKNAVDFTYSGHVPTKCPKYASDQKRLTSPRGSDESD